jgi:hypothetical protein
MTIMKNWKKGGNKRISSQLAEEIRKTTEDLCRVADVGGENPSWHLMCNSLNRSVLEPGSCDVSVSSPTKTSLCWSCSVLKCWEVQTRPADKLEPQSPASSQFQTHILEQFSLHPIFWTHFLLNYEVLYGFTDARFWIVKNPPPSLRYAVRSRVWGHLLKNLLPQSASPIVTQQ